MSRPQLNQGAFQNTGNDNRFKVWAEGIDPVKISKKPGESSYIKILPGFEYDDNLAPVPGTAAPTRYEDGSPTIFAATVYVNEYCGYGKPGAGGKRRDFIGMQTFGEPENCILTKVCDYCYANLDEWAFVVGMTPGYEKDGRPKHNSDGSVRYERSDNRDDELLSRPQPILLFNGVDAENVMAGPKLFRLTKSAATSMFSEQGVIYKGNINATQEMIDADINNAYEAGDFVDLATGSVLQIERLNDNGPRSGYAIRLGVRMVPGQAASIMQLPLDPSVLESRIDLYNVASYVKKPTPEKVVADLVAVLDRWSPDGTRHPYDMLKLVLGTEYDIPDAPNPAITQAPPNNPADAPAPPAPMFNTATPTPAKPSGPVMSNAAFGAAPVVTPAADRSNPDLNPVTAPAPVANTAATVQAPAAPQGLPTGVPGAAGPSPESRASFIAGMKK